MGGSKGRSQGYGKFPPADLETIIISGGTVVVLKAEIFCAYPGLKIAYIVAPVSAGASPAALICK
jgi:hypothetical protein